MNNKDFDPIFILYQIVALQCFFYLAMGTIWGIAHVAFETPVSLDRFFTSNYINFVTVSGWLEAFCTISSSLAGSYLLENIVERSKKCVDFTFTLYFLHVLASMMYSQQFPLEWEWWLVLVFSSVTMASLGEYLCSRNELQDIPLYSPESKS